MRGEGRGRVGAAALLAAAVGGCVSANDDDSAVPPPEPLVVVTFNTGTTEGLPHEAAPDDGYGDEQAAISDAWYGDGLAWSPVVEDARAWFAETPADIVGFQEVFWSGECPGIPGDFHPGWVCDGWSDGDPTVAQTVLGAGWQVACHAGKPDKCVAVRRAVGTIVGCDDALCLDALDGAEVEGCGSGSRVGRARVALVDGGELTVVHVHGSSGLSADDKACREAQFRLVFEDLGDGEPAANGDRNVVLGDFNTDPGRFLGTDASAAYLAGVADGSEYAFHTEVGPDATPTYAGLANIDHVLSDGFVGDCWHAGIDGREAVSDAVYFDHVPAVCALEPR